MSILTTRIELTQTPVLTAAFQFCWMVTPQRPMPGSASWQEMYRLAYEHARATSAAERFRRLTRVSLN